MAFYQNTIKEQGPTEEPTTPDLRTDTEKAVDVINKASEEEDDVEMAKRMKFAQGYYETTTKMYYFKLIICLTLK